MRSSAAARIREREIPRTAPGPAEIRGRVPAQDLPAEAAVLSAILLAPNTGTIDEVRDLLAAEMFFSDSNGRIYEACCALRDANVPIDVISVASYLRDRDRLAQVGGPSYLAELADATPAIAHVMAHAQIVFEKWRLRSTVAICQVTAAEGYGDVGGVQDFIDGHVASIHAIATRNAGAPIARMGDGLMHRLQKDWERVQAGETLMGLRSGLERLDAKISGFNPGDLYVIAARPGMGKTALALQVAEGLASPKETPGLFQAPVEYGVLVFSLEMPKDQLQVRTACTSASVSLHAYRQGNLQPEDWTRIFEAGAYLTSIPIWIDDTAGLTLSQLRAKARQVASRWCRPASRDADGRIVPERRMGAIIIDYLQLVRSSTPGRSREEEVAEVSRELKALAKQLEVPVIALSQLNRSVETRNAKDKRPQLSDLRESGAVEQDADVVIFIYRDEYYFPDKDAARGVAELIIAKQRNGPPGKVLARFDSRYMRFGNIDPATAAKYEGDAGEE